MSDGEIAVLRIAGVLKASCKGDNGAVRTIK